MRYRAGVVLLSLIAACERGSGNENPGDGSAGGAGIAGRGGTPGGAGAAGSSPGRGGAPGIAGASGSMARAGAAGSLNDHGGSAGAFATGGTAGSTSGASGATQESCGGAAGEGGAGAGAGEGGTSGNAGEGGTGGEAGADSEPRGLSWPIDCIPHQTCVGLGYPDTDQNGDAHDCSEPGYVGHEGTDIAISAEAQAAGTAVRAAADGVVLFVFDGKYDQCPNETEPDCQNVEVTGPGSTSGTTVCTPLGPYCGTGEPGCYWCFAGGNVVVLRHEGVPGVFATRYDHLKKNSILVEPGESVRRGQKIAEAASAGNSTAPHLHFEVWGSGFYEVADPWAGACGPNTGPSLWAYDPPWAG